MKKILILALGVVLAMLLLVGCATEESVPIGAKVRLLGSGGSYINMYSARILTDPNNPEVLMVPAGKECEVLSEPRRVESATYCEVDCSWVEGFAVKGSMLKGWVDVTNLEVLD